MKITDVRIKLVGGESGRSRLRAFCTLIFDNAFVVTDLKILEGDQGFFVAMPSRKITFHCPYCRHKVIVGSNYCSSCGESVSDAEVARMLAGLNPSKLFVDIVHPINTASREYIHTAVVEAYRRELERAALPGYVSNYDDMFVGDL